MTAPHSALRRRGRVASLVVLVTIALGVAGLGPAAALPRAAQPSSWDSRIKPIAEEVEKLRKLDFKHPVAVRFLSEKAFEKQQRHERSDLSKSQEQELQRSQAQLRALGLIGQHVDLFEAGNDIGSTDVLAYYDPAKKRVTVKGTGDLSAATKVTLAHELTHALQDQHFDLSKIQRAAARDHAQSAARALIEGDAVRIQSLYQAQLSAADQQSADDESKAQSDQARSDAEKQSIPPLMLAFFEAPYAFGPPLVQVADSDLHGGVDGLFRKPPANESAFLTPSTLVEGAKFTKVPLPKLAKGEKRVGKPDVFGAFTLYLLLASRDDLGQSLRAADGWGGDSMVSFEHKGKNCLRATFVGRDADRTTAIGDALDTWATPMPPGAASVTRGKSNVTLTACDTGAAVPQPTHDGDQVLAYAAGRDSLYAGLLKSGATSTVAACSASGIVQDPVFAPLLANPNQEPDPSTVNQLRSRVQQIALDCARSSRT